MWFRNCVKKLLNLLRNLLVNPDLLGSDIVLPVKYS